MGESLVLTVDTRVGSVVAQMSGPASERSPATSEHRLRLRAAQRRPPRSPIVYGRVAKIEQSYPREVRVPPPLLVLVLLTAGLVRAAGLLASAVLGSARAQGGKPRGWKALRQGPEYLVTPVLVRDAGDKLVPLEIHGHMSDSALVRTDRIRAHVRWPRDQRLPPRAVRIENLATGRMLTPRGATLWSHLGVGLVLQALLGLALLALTATCLLGWL